VETATEPTFQAKFVAAMAFPHASAPSPHLSAVVTLPDRISRDADSPRGARRRRLRAESDSDPVLEETP
jgi:uncharacterized 2Fe-2S/4Fe-4S cluster protein (DUF4445 family)